MEGFLRFNMSYLSIFFYLVLLIFLLYKVTCSLPITRKLSESLSASHNVFTPKILLLNLAINNTLSIWLLWCPFCNFHVPLYIFLCGNMMLLILRSIPMAKPISLSSLSFVNWCKLWSPIMGLKQSSRPIFAIKLPKIGCILQIIQFFLSRSE